VAKCYRMWYEVYEKMLLIFGQVQCEQYANALDKLVFSSMFKRLDGKCCDGFRTDNQFSSILCATVLLQCTNCALF